ncbi:SDR family oxidoreductase [Melioribacter sp. OK-6-Me]|uniref:SDR family oxidoreductase n=1 Tax=unclassified Melioribacter TaxID=2627329 RepID=UPI003ED95B4D
MEYINTLFSIEGKVILVTGGSGIIATAITEGLLKCGANVILISRNEEKLKQICNSFKELGKIDYIKCDVLKEVDVENAKEQVLKKYGKIDVLINGAGGNLPEATLKPEENIFDLSFENFKKAVDLNLHGTVLPTLKFGLPMARNGSGSIINISSMASLRAITRVAGYSAAKAAVDNFTRWMAMELALKFGDGLRVNAIAPGFLITNQNRTLLTNIDGSLTDRGKSIIKMTPFKRFGHPAELVGTVIWLASDASKFVTGTVIPVDGGFSIFSGV